MKIDGHSLNKLSRGWELLHKIAVVLFHATEVDCETFIQSTVGPDCVELETSCRFDDYAIAIHNHEYINKSISFYSEQFNCTHIADKQLYKLAIEISPREYWTAENN